MQTYAIKYLVEDPTVCPLDTDSRREIITKLPLFSNIITSIM